MPKRQSKLWFIFPDIHVPNHDETALECALKAHALLKPHYTVFLGDLMDCELFSSHRKRLITETLAYDFKQIEVQPTKDLLDRVQKNTKEHTYLLSGNHEERIERWASNSGQISQSLFSMLNPEIVLSENRKKFTFVPYSLSDGGHAHIRIASDLVAVHGWSWAKHAAQIHLEKSRSQSIVFGHSHRHQVASARDPWTGKIIKAFNPGTLSKLQPIYMVGGNPSDWSHGFAIVYVGKGKTNWTEYCITIKEGYCVLPDGTEIKV
jgi:predicted phosphodiesterase